MAIRDVVRFPDPRLSTTCSELPVGAAPSMAVRDLARDLVDTMRSSPGCVGIAAPQVGELVRMIAIDVTGHRRAASCHGELVLCNPVVVERAGSIVMREGCLSIPDFTANVRRAERITVTATDVEGAELTLEADAYEARVLLHEIDHLDGLLFLDRVESAHDVFPRRERRGRT